MSKASFQSFPNSKLGSNKLGMCPQCKKDHAYLINNTNVPQNCLFCGYIIPPNQASIPAKPIHPIMQLNIRIISCENIPQPKELRAIDPYISFKLSFDGKINSTRVIDDTSNPIWNSDFEITISPSYNLPSFGIDIFLYCHDPFEEDFLIGSMSEIIENLQPYEIRDLSYNLNIIGFDEPNENSKNKTVRFIKHDNEKTKVNIQVQMAPLFHPPFQPQGAPPRVIEDHEIIIEGGPIFNQDYLYDSFGGPISKFTGKSFSPAQFHGIYNSFNRKKNSAEPHFDVDFSSSFGGKSQSTNNPLYSPYSSYFSKQISETSTKNINFKPNSIDITPRPPYSPVQSAWESSLSAGTKNMQPKAIPKAQSTIGGINSNRQSPSLMKIYDYEEEDDNYDVNSSFSYYNTDLSGSDSYDESTDVIEIGQSFPKQSKSSKLTSKVKTPIQKFKDASPPSRLPATYKMSTTPTIQPVSTMKPMAKTITQKNGAQNADPIKPPNNSPPGIVSKIYNHEEKQKRQKSKTDKNEGMVPESIPPVPVAAINNPSPKHISYKRKFVSQNPTKPVNINPDANGTAVNKNTHMKFIYKRNDSSIPTPTVQFSFEPGKK